MTQESSPFAPVLTPAFARLRTALQQVRPAPPQVLLLEGGTEAERQALARYWAAALNCPQDNAPCLTCGSCQQIGAGQHWDMLAYDGRISNKEDEDNPGPVRAFNMDNVRQLKTRLRDAPHGEGRRVVLLSGLDLTRDEAANALLKVLEEPSATTVFVLMAPQREQLLPTLVSRAWVLTLPWPEPDAASAEMATWEQALAFFLERGTGWLEKTSARGAVTPAVAGQVLLACQKALSAALRGAETASAAQGMRGGRQAGALLGPLGRLPLEQRCAAAVLTATAQDTLQDNVNPARVLDWLAVRLYTLARKA